MADIKELTSPHLVMSEGATRLSQEVGPARHHRSVHGAKTFSFNGQFVKNEARDAIRGFFLPFSGVYAAVTGRDVVFVRRDKSGHFVRERKSHKKRG